MSQEIRTQLIKAAADLLTGEWSSDYAEDHPPRTPKKVIRGLEKDAIHRNKLSRILKECADKL